jgi:hypothetical protein
MRVYEFGRYSPQYASVQAIQINGTSIVVDGYSSNNSYASVVPGDDVRLTNGASGSFQKMLVKVTLDVPRAQLGHTPTILRADLRVAALESAGGAGSYTVRAYTFRVSPDFTDATYRYRDSTGPITWYMNAYSPVPGQDIAYTPFDTQVFAVSGIPTTWNGAFNVTSPVTEALRSSKNLELLLWSQTVASFSIGWNIGGSSRRPYLKVHYLFPYEFFLCDTFGDIDMASMVDTLADENPYNLGAIERGETGTAVKGVLKNFSGRAAALVEILDDHPEWSEPSQIAGAGTGQLDYVAPSDAAGSQKYTVKFSSASAYEVLAEAYRDNIESYHPAYDADPTWQGDTSTDFTAPEGGLTIPAAAWQPGTQVNDEFRVYVRGNSSDLTWPADSASQMQITHDSAGSPDAAGWRPINGRRTRSTAAVTVDGATKLFPTRAIDSAQWPVGTRAFVGDGTNLHEGTVNSAQEAEVGATVFTGVGLDDCAISGNYNGTFDDDVVVEIDATGAQDTYKLSYDGGSSWAVTGENCTTTGTLHDYGIIVTFGAITGHTATDYWTAPVQSFGVELTGLSVDSTVYAAGARIGTGLPVDGMAAAVWGVTTAGAGPSEAVDNRVYLQGSPPDDLAPAAAGFVMGQTIYITDVEGATHEEGEILTVAATYVDLTANLANDYVAGSIVVVKGSGEAPFWLRAVAGSGTTEELKRARINARV